MEATALYIHIPFCTKKCKYCAFSVLTDQSQKQEYLVALKKELTARLSNDLSIKTIYFGGGTPSTLTLDEVEDLLTFISSAGDISECIEVSFEVNPEHITKEYVNGLKKLGITRISMGIQSLDNTALKTAGRNHDADTARNAMGILQQSTISWNADIILGLPGHEPESTLDDLEEIMSYKPSHIALYFLTIETGTEFSLHEKAFFPKEKHILAIHSKLLQSFEKKGYQQYEISNWALPGYESKHNLMYWTGQNYVGAGLGASSHINNTVFNNYKNMNLYLKQEDKVEPSSMQLLDPLDQWYLLMMTGLRLQHGIPFKNLENNINGLQKKALLQTIEHLQMQGLVILDSHLKLTPKGRLYADFVTEKLRTIL